MPKNATGIYKRKDGRYEGQYYHDINPKTGKRRKYSVYAATSKEAKEKLQALMHDLASGIYVEKTKLTLEAWLEQWLKVYALPKVKQSTYTSYRAYIFKHVNPNIGKVTLKNLRVDILQEFFNERAVSGRIDGKGGLSAKTLKNMHTMLKTALKQAVENDLIPKNPATFVKLPKAPSREMRVLTSEEQAKVVAELKQSTQRYAIGILIALFTGMRIGEVCGLQWSDFDEKTSEMHVRRTLGRLATMDATKGKTEIVISTPKSDKSARSIPLPVFLACALQQRHLQAKQERLGVGAGYDPREFILCNELGSPIEPRTMQDTLTRIIKSAGISHANLHSLRHTFATRAIEMGMDIKTLSDILGHADVSTTLNRYAHSLDMHKRKAMDMMGTLYTATRSGEK